MMKPKNKSAEPGFRLLFDKNRAAAILGVSTRTVESLFYKGKLPAVRIGRRVLFHIEAIEAFARRGAA